PTDLHLGGARRQLVLRYPLPHPARTLAGSADFSGWLTSGLGERIRIAAVDMTANASLLLCTRVMRRLHAGSLLG
ncbi:MAG: hypothetical protein OEU99_11405, partial [Nitrospira sp.]|nr:hypothetical protein [Nitrospira sp.]